MSYPFIRVNNEKWQGAYFRAFRQFPWPFHMQDNALGDAIMAGFRHCPGSAEHGMAAAMAQAVCLGNIVQKPRRSGRGRRCVHTHACGLFGQAFRYMRHQQGMSAYIGQHVILAPECETSFIIRWWGLILAFHKWGRHIGERPHGFFAFARA